MFPYLRVPLFMIMPCLPAATLFAQGQVEVASPAALKTALAAAQPGAVIVIRNGTYTNAIWEIDATGTAEAPVTVRAQSPGRVISRGQSALRLSGSHVVVAGLLFMDGYLPGSAVIEFRSLNGQKAANHCRITNCAIVDYAHPNPRTRVHWVSFYGRHNRLDHSYFSNHNNNGVTVVVWLSNNDPAPVYHRIDGNHFANRPFGNENGWETIRIGDSDTSLLDARVTVADNLFSFCDGEIEVISNKSCENTYRNNVFDQTQGMLTLRHGDRCLIDGNWFLGAGRTQTGGIRVMGRDHVVINNYIERTAGRDGAAITVYCGVGGDNPPLNSYFPADRALVAHNTIIGVGGNAYLELASRYNQDYQVSATDIRKIDVLPRDVVVANNMLWAPAGGAGVMVAGQTVADHVFAGNILYGTVPPGPVIPATGYQVIDPGMEQADGVWQPAAASGMLGGAVGLDPAVAEDILGRARAAPFDPGAFQVSGGASPTRPPRPVADTTGPDWLGAERDLRVVLWPLHPDFFAGAAAELQRGWLAVDWLGWVHVAAFPWVYVDALDDYAFFAGAGGDGGHWLHDPSWDWCYTSAAIHPFIFSTQHGWLYLHGMADGQRLFSLLDQGE
jgi:poly(beta-D-mannuronate) lyase